MLSYMIICINKYLISAFLVPFFKFSVMCMYRIMWCECRSLEARGMYFSATEVKAVVSSLTWVRGTVLCKSSELSQLPRSPSAFSLLVSVRITGSTVGCEDTHPVKYGLLLFEIIWVGSEENGEHGLTHWGEVRRIAVCWAERANWVKGVRPGWD